ncbi:MAG: hypothetical protein GEU83_14300 [Pseudonocardiaceae bacterium]|nr:hypothetical protein [Pseudonocardiaceae bacterium]
MPGELRVDTALLREAGAGLRFVATEFQHANARSDDAADATGHPELAEAVRSFAHSWDDRRAKMVENIAALAKSATGIGEAFEELDREFAASLRGER